MQKKLFLDLFYKYYRELYHEFYYYSATTSDLVEDLKNHYPAQYNHILKLYNQGYTQ